MPRITVADVVGAMEHLGHAYCYYGLRTVSADDPVTVGEVVGPSYRHDDWLESPEQMDGTSAIGVWADLDEEEIAARIQSATEYIGDRVVLLGAQRMEYGEDQGEIVMRDAVALAIWTCEGH